MISRLQQIKQKGYNSEDAFGLNDIAKALKTIKVELMENGEWRAVSDVLNDIAEKWDDLDDKTKGYIATVMGGTRQRNYLLTLLNDMAKGAENGSRAWELYAGAQEAAGVAMEKYAIWEESVEAAQNRLTVATEQLYSMLSGELLKGWYDTLAWIINGINSAAEATDGWNIKIGLLGGALALLILSITKVTAATGSAVFSAKTWSYALTGVTTSATGATVATNMLGVALRSIGIGIAIAAVGQLVGWIMSLGEKAVDAGEAVRAATEKIDQGFSNLKTMEEFKARLDAIDTSTNATKEDIDQFNAVRRDMISTFPDMKNGLGDEVTAVDDLADAYKNARDEVKKLWDEQTKANWRTANAQAENASEILRSSQNVLTGGTTIPSVESGMPLGGYITNAVDNKGEGFNLSDLDEMKREIELRLDGMVDVKAVLDKYEIEASEFALKWAELKPAHDAYQKEFRKLWEAAGKPDIGNQKQWSQEMLDLYAQEGKYLDQVTEELSGIADQVEEYAAAENILYILTDIREHRQQTVLEEARKAAKITLEDALNPYKYPELNALSINSMIEGILRAADQQQEETGEIYGEADLRAAAKDAVNRYNKAKTEAVAYLQEFFEEGVDYSTGDNLT